MLAHRDWASEARDDGWHIEIVTPDGAVLCPEATLVELNTANGQVGILRGHAPLFVTLEVGELVIHNGRRRDTFLVGGGFARILPNRISVLALSLETCKDNAARTRCASRRNELLDDAQAEQDPWE